MNLLRKMYSITPIRYAFKMTVCLCDFYISLFFGSVNTVPRIARVVGAQHPLNPPVLRPYPFENTVERIRNRRMFRQYEDEVISQIFDSRFRSRQLFVNSPQREGPDQIDQFLYYSQIHRTFERIYFRVLKKMKQSGAEIPDGLNQKLRQLEQYRFDNFELLVPKV